MMEYICQYTNRYYRHTHTHTHTLSTSVADSLLSPLSLPTPESLSCFFCCSMSSTLQTHNTGHTHTNEMCACVEGDEIKSMREREREILFLTPPLRLCSPFQTSCSDWILFLLPTARIVLLSLTKENGREKERKLKKRFHLFDSHFTAKQTGNIFLNTLKNHTFINKKKGKMFTVCVIKR